MVVDQLTDVDIACTGDEADAGDTTCGSDQLGELSGRLNVDLGSYDCANVALAPTRYQPGTLSGLVAGLAGTPASLGSIGGGETKCFIVGVDYNANVAASLKQQAQSDRTTWRFVFTGQAS